MTNTTTFKNLLSGEEMFSLFEIIDGCRECGLEKFKGLMTDLGRMINSRKCMCILTHPKAKGRTEHFDILNVSYPEEWAKSYIEKRYSEIDPAVIHNHANSGMQRLSDTYHNSNGTPHEFLAELRLYKIDKGYAYGVKDGQKRENSLFFFSTPKEDNPERAAAVLERTVPHFHNALKSVIRQKKKEEMCNLTPQEKKIMEGLRNGKTDSEVSKDIEISEHTVKFHVKNIMGKLGAKNRVHALAIAVKKGLVEL